MLKKKKSKKNAAHNIMYTPQTRIHKCGLHSSICVQQLQNHLPCKAAKMEGFQVFESWRSIVKSSSLNCSAARIRPNQSVLLEEKEAAATGRVPRKCESTSRKCHTVINQHHWTCKKTDWSILIVTNRIYISSSFNI